LPRAGRLSFALWALYEFYDYVRMRLRFLRLRGANFARSTRRSKFLALRKALKYIALGGIGVSAKPYGFFALDARRYNIQAQAFIIQTNNHLPHAGPRHPRPELSRFRKSVRTRARAPPPQRAQRALARAPPNNGSNPLHHARPCAARNQPHRASTALIQVCHVPRWAAPHATDATTRGARAHVRTRTTTDTHTTTHTHTHAHAGARAHTPWIQQQSVDAHTTHRDTCAVRKHCTDHLSAAHTPRPSRCVGIRPRATTDAARATF
jgi:hypothetical protein